MKLLDTTFLIDFLEGKLEDLTILKNLDNGLLYTTYLNMFEVLFGIFYSNTKIDERIARANLLFDRLNVLGINKEATIRSATIRTKLIKEGREIDIIDCLIAGISLEEGINTILTKNKKHFERIPGIKVEEY